MVRKISTKSSLHHHEVKERLKGHNLRKTIKSRLNINSDFCFLNVQERMESNQYESVQALVRQLHAPQKNVSRPHSDEETSNDDEKDRKQSVCTLPILAVEKPLRKRSIFDATFKIPVLTVTAANSPESPENFGLRRFSFGNFRRHSHTAVRHLNYFAFRYRNIKEICLISI